MHGRLFTFFDTPVPSYFALIVIGFVFAATMGALWARRVGQNPDVIVDLGLVSILAGFVGARLLHVFADGYFMDYVHLCTDPSLVDWRITKAECASATYAGAWDAAKGVCHPVKTNCFAWAELGGGFTFFGGLIAATFAAWWLFRRDRFPFWKAVDMGGMMVPIGLGFGRLGCLLAGCCFGRIEPGLPWALRFPSASPASDWQAREGHLENHLLPSLPVHPTQLYESLAAFAIAAFGILYLHGRKRYDGQVFVAFLASYGVARFSIEFFRSDDRGGAFGLSTSQWISVGLMVAAVVLHWRRRPTGLPPRSAPAAQAVTLTALLGLLALLGCSAEVPERYPALNDRCTSEHCLNAPPSRGGGGADGDASQNAADAAAPAGSGVTLGGTVSVAVSQDFLTLRPLEDAALELSVTGAGGDVEVLQYSPGQTFELGAAELPARVAVRKLSGSAELMTTLQWVDEPAQDLQLLIASPGILLDVAENLSLNPTPLDAAAGHAVLRFVTPQGAALSDVSLLGTSVQAADVIVAYDLGGTYTDSTVATAERGTAMVLNLPAVSLPGSAIAFDLQVAGERRSVDVWVAAGAVSLRDVVLQP